MKNNEIITALILDKLGWSISDPNDEHQHAITDNTSHACIAYIEVHRFYDESMYFYDDGNVAT